MFKILVLQALYNLSDDQAEFVIQDRLSFLRFLGLGLSEKVPDAKTIWLFRECLVRAGAIDKARATDNGLRALARYGQNVLPTATGRKSWLFCDTVEGAKASAVIYSLMLTCRACAVEPFACTNCCPGSGNVHRRQPSCWRPDDGGFCRPPEDHPRSCRADSDAARCRAVHHQAQSAARGIAGGDGLDQQPHLRIPHA